MPGSGKLFLALLIVVAGIFYLLTIQHGHSWGGDFSLYVAHARNIALGMPYADTGYIQNPDYPWLSPQVYPPVFPLILAPLYSIFGLNLYVFKIAILVFFLSFLAVCHQYCQPRFSTLICRYGFLLAIAFSPWLWDIRNKVISDIPFVFFVYLTLYLMDRLSNASSGTDRKVMLAALTGITAYLAYGTRTLGIVLIPALAVFDIIHHRRIRRETLVAAGIFVVLFLVQAHYIDSNRAYTEIVANSATTHTHAATAAFHDRIIQGAAWIVNNITGNVSNYAWVIQRYWDNSFSIIVRIAVLAVTSLLFLAGFFTLLRKQASPGEYFMVLYIVAIVVVPFFQGTRYLLPVIPLYVLYIFRGAEAAMTGQRTEMARFIPHILIFLIAMTYAGAYADRSFTAGSLGVEDRESMQMFAFIRQSTARDCVIMFRTPRVLALYTGRKASTYGDRQTTEQVREYMKRINATYLILNLSNDQNDHGQRHDSESFRMLPSLYRDEFETVFKNRDYEVYHVMLEPGSPGQEGSGAS